MTRQVFLSFDQETFGEWPYRASIQMLGAPKRPYGPAGFLYAGGLTEEYAIENLKRVLDEWVNGPSLPDDYPKTIEVDW